MPQSQPPSHRPLRVGEELRHALADIFARGLTRDPDLDGLILTVSEVRVTPDLKTATVYVRALGQDAPKLPAALARDAKHLRTELARRVHLRGVPDLRFRTDETLDEADRITALLRRPDVARDLDPSPGTGERSAAPAAKVRERRP